jgi:hypothetical protein
VQSRSTELTCARALPFAALPPVDRDHLRHLLWRSGKLIRVRKLPQAGAPGAAWWFDRAEPQALTRFFFASAPCA